MAKLVRLDLGGNLLQVNVSVCHLNLLQKNQTSNLGSQEVNCHLKHLKHRQVGEFVCVTSRSKYQCVAVGLIIFTSFFLFFGGTPLAEKIR